MTIVDVLILTAAALAVITVAGCILLAQVRQPPHKRERDPFWMFERTRTRTHARVR